MECKLTLQGTYGPNMNAFWWVVCEMHPTWETSPQLCEKLCRKFHEHDGCTNERMNKGNGENYKPLGINARGIKIITHFKCSEDSSGESGHQWLEFQPVSEFQEQIKRIGLAALLNNCWLVFAQFGTCPFYVKELFKNYTTKLLSGTGTVLELTFF